jgi:hypothetical protein
MDCPYVIRPGKGFAQVGLALAGGGLEPVGWMSGLPGPDFYIRTKILARQSVFGQI